MYEGGRGPGGLAARRVVLTKKDGMKILITGGAGFIGSAVVRRAVADGHEVVNLDALTYSANLENVACVAAMNSCSNRVRPYGTSAVSRSVRSDA